MLGSSDILQISPEQYTVKRLWLLQPYFGYLSCIPFVYVTHEVQGVLRI